MQHLPTITIANGFWQRFKGLMLSKPLPTDRALLISRCSSVHTFFMRYALDLIYLDNDNRVVKLVRGVKPWRMSWGGTGATQILEMTTGGIDLFAIQMGEPMVISNATENGHAAHAT